jgi:hypothetical protein
LEEAFKYTLVRRRTDLGPTDPFVAVAAGRSLFRVDDLLRVALLVGEIGAETCK